jgi:murein DD-endopeptidase MepM/ murein hydrolase activator NlpD
MPRIVSCSRNWPRYLILAAVGVSAAGCADSARFDSSPYTQRSAPQSEVTGSIAARPTPRVEAQPLPPPAAQPAGVASGAQGLGTYRPQTRVPEYTGSVAVNRPAPAPAPAPVQPQGRWTWDGGSPVVVAQGETLEIVARKYGVPASAISQTTGLHGPVQPGQRLVIPRYVSAAGAPAPRQIAHAEPPRPAPIAAPAPASVQQPQRQAVSNQVHVVQPGESLIGIAKHYNVPLNELAHANRIEPYAKVSMGDQLTIPGTAHPRVASAAPPVTHIEPQRAAPQVAAPRIAPANDRVGSVPQNAQVAMPQAVPEPQSPAKSADPVSSQVSFRWPVTGHIVEGFGQRANGTTNDGINFAVPEGTPVRAAEDGVVAYAGNELKTFGNLVLVRHADNYVTAYANASEIMVKRGDSVRRGQVIAKSGQTGSVSTPQLHFEIRKNSTPVDPRKFLASK